MPGTTAWMLVATALVLLMAPALAIFYGGMVRSSSVLNMLMMTFGATAAILVAWTLASATGWLPTHVLPSPRAIATAAWDAIADGSLVADVAVSFRRAVSGFLVGGGILVHGLPPVHHAIEHLAGMDCARCSLPPLSGCALDISCRRIFLSASIVAGNSFRPSIPSAETPVDILDATASACARHCVSLP